MARETSARNRTLLTEEEVEERWPIVLAAIDQYNQGYFFEAHETLEELWLPSPWPVRQFLQGIIQLAAAFVHLMRHEYPGTVRLLNRALEKLESFPPDYRGIDVARLVSDTRRAHDDLVALGPERFEEWDRGRIPRIRLVGSDEAPASGAR